MTIEEKLKMYHEKKSFIAALSNVFARHKSGHTVSGIVYEVFHKEVEGNHYFNEWIVVHYDGGGWCVCRVNGNSNNANYRAIGKLIDGGYYAEDIDYVRQDEVGFKKVNLAKMVLTTEG